MANIQVHSNNYPGSSYEPLHSFQYLVAGNITADATAKPLFVVPTLMAGWKIVSTNLTVGQNGVDASNALNLEADVLVNAVSVHTTKPKIDKAAGTGKRTTIGTGTTTGITRTVLDSTKVTLAAGDVITVTLDITRTASPSTEIADVYLSVVVQPQQETIP